MVKFISIAKYTISNHEIFPREENNNNDNNKW